MRDGRIWVITAAIGVFTVGLGLLVVTAQRTAEIGDRGPDIDKAATVAPSTREVPGGAGSATDWGFPVIEPRSAVPLQLGSVPGFSSDDESVNAETEAFTAGMILYVNWQVGRAIQTCMIGQGYDWSLEVPQRVETTQALEFWGQDGGRGIPFFTGPYGTEPNDSMIAGQPDGGTGALRALYGDGTSIAKASLEYYSGEEWAEFNAWDLAFDSAQSYLELPRITGEGGGAHVLDRAGGCVGVARDEWGHLALVPEELSEAYRDAVWAVGDDPAAAQALEAYGRCAVAMGGSADVEQIELVAQEEYDLVSSIDEECRKPYSDVLQALTALAQDEFVRAHADELLARRAAFEAIYDDAAGDADFQEFVVYLSSFAS